MTSQPLTYHAGLISGDYVNQWREGLHVVCSRGEQVSVRAAGQDTPRHPGARSPEGPSRQPLVQMEPSGIVRKTIKSAAYPLRVVLVFAHETVRMVWGRVWGAWVRESRCAGASSRAGAIPSYAVLRAGVLAVGHNRAGVFHGARSSGTVQLAVGGERLGASALSSASVRTLWGDTPVAGASQEPGFCGQPARESRAALSLVSHARPSGRD